MCSWALNVTPSAPTISWLRCREAEAMCSLLFSPTRSGVGTSRAACSPQEGVRPVNFGKFAGPASRCPPAAVGACGRYPVAYRRIKSISGPPALRQGTRCPVWR